MKIQNLLLMIFLALAVVIVPSVHADTVSLTSPAQGDVLGGTVKFQALISAFNNYTNCTFYAYASNTQNSTASQVNFSTNTSFGKLDTRQFNGSFSSTALEDSSLYSAYVVCKNLTQTLTSSTVTGIIVDNTKPQTPTLSSPSAGTTDTDGSVSFSSTVVGANTTSCTLYIGSNVHTMTHSGNTCTATISNIPDLSYDWYIIASDDKNSSTSVSRNLVVNKPHTSGKALAVLESQGNAKVTSSKTFSIADISVTSLLESYWYVLVIVVLGLLWYMKKR